MGSHKIGIVCGCLPSQYGIPASDLYHQVLSKKTREEFGVELKVCSIWYTTLAESEAKALELTDREKPLTLIYHIRPDPFLRASKFLIRYLNQAQTAVVKLNFSADDSCVVDVENAARVELLRKRKSTFKLFFRNFNYCIGIILGTSEKAIKKEVKIIDCVQHFCITKNVAFVLVGPPSRPGNKLEDFLLKRLERRISTRYEQRIYVNCMGEKNAVGQSLFKEDKIHLSTAGHLKMAELIFEKVKTVFSN